MTAGRGSAAEAGGRPDGAGVSDLARQYRAARESAILIDRSGLGRLAIRGKDALDLLHRLTTNSIRTLMPGQGTAAVFTTAKGRIIDLVTFHLLPDHLLCLTGPGRAGAVRDWIERYTFREEVAVEDLTLSHATLGIFGAGAAGPVASLCGEAAAGRPLHHPALVRIDGAAAVLARTWPLLGEGFHLTAEVASLQRLRERVLGSGVIPAGNECFELLRIESGLPAAGRELTEEFNPWEARLDDAISLDKGCYVGQEVIARLNTYRKVSKLLVRLAFASEAAPAVPAPLLAGGQVIGTLTSAAAVPREKRVVALGYVRDEDAAEGKVVEVATAGAPPLAGRILGAAR